MNHPIINISYMMRRALNTLDYRLMDHGERVAYLLIQMSKADGIYSPEQLTKICYMGLFHDIGAYQTESLASVLEPMRSVDFEIADPLPHSIYGYLFFKEYPFFCEYCDALLFHHFTYERLLKTDCQNKKIAARLFLADKLDFMMAGGMVKTLDEIKLRLNNPVFSKEECALLLSLEEKTQVLSKCLNGEYLQELLEYLDKENNEGEHVELLAHMLPHVIDFRSEYTVTHTTTTVEITMLLADLFDLSEKEKKDIYFGALLHDVGKISVSTVLLEKTSRLTPTEYLIIQDHVLLSEHILKSCVSKEVFDIAVRHHEKLNGAGYPHHLVAQDLNLPQRIVAVADVMSALMGKRSYKDSFSKEKVTAIMKEMAERGELCSHIIDKALENYSYIASMVLKCSDEALERYGDLNSQAEFLITRYS